MVRSARFILVLLLGFVAPAGTVAQNVVTLQTRDGMFYSDIVLNDAITVRALVDSGAYYLHLCQETARALGLVLGEEVVVTGFDGPVVTRRATVRSLRLGSIEVRDVSTLVRVGGDQGPCRPVDVLIGLVVLGRLNAVMLTGNTLTLVGPPPVPEVNTSAAARPRRSREWK